jgi:hypothetical protein
VREGPDSEQPMEPMDMDDAFGAFVTRLQAMPVSDPRSRAAILARVRGRRQSPWRAALVWAWQPSVPVLAAAAVVVAALGAGYAGRVLVEPPQPVVAAADGDATGALVPAEFFPVADAAGARLIPTQFWFEAPNANRVAIVGDFNGWNRSAATAALKDPARNGVWEVTLLLPPGRYTYAFLVNDSILVADPRMPREPEDPDFGRPRSAILVNER